MGQFVQRYLRLVHSPTTPFGGNDSAVDGPQITGGSVRRWKRVTGDSPFMARAAPRGAASDSAWTSLRPSERTLRKVAGEWRVAGHTLPQLACRGTAKGRARVSAGVWDELAERDTS